MCTRGRKMRLPYNVNRALAGLLLAALLFFGTNYYLELGFFGRGAKLLMISVLGIGVIYSAFFVPTRQEMREHREAKRAARNRNGA